MLFLLARLKRGVTLGQAQASLNVIANRLSRQHPKTDAAATPRVFPQREARLSPQPQPGHYRRLLAAFALFLGLALVLLPLACFNVANILLVRATSREHEMAILAVIGVYGVVSYAASRRTREIGIRIALGARTSQIMKMVFGQGLLIVGLGVFFGLLAACAAAQVLKVLLYGVSAYDPFTFIGVAILLALVSLLACYVPARRAAKVDPMVALRHE